jgi:hypothetical protein
LIDRIKAAEQRIQDGHAPRRIPADPTDVDLVLAEVRYLLEGKQPPFWIAATPPAAQRPDVDALVALARADEREACAKVIESWRKWGADVALLVKAIRTMSDPVCTASPAAQREWVGLTDEEMQALWGRYAHMEMMRAIEAKLKEKNT